MRFSGSSVRQVILLSYGKIMLNMPMQLTINIPDQVAKIASGQGVSTEVYVERLVVQTVSGETATTDPQKVRVAVDDFGAFEKVFVLKGSKLEISSMRAANTKLAALFDARNSEHLSKDRS
jgi:hypothetical protein